MATKEELSIWEEHNKKYDELLLYGAENGLVFSYDKEFFDKLREYYCGGISVPVSLLVRRLVNGFCYEKAPLVTLAFDDDYNVVCGEINTIKLNPIYIDQVREDKLVDTYADHCYVERYCDSDTWVYDTTIGLIIEKSLYEKMENPKVRLRQSKMETEELLKGYVSKELSKQDIVASRYMLGLLSRQLDPVQELYKEDLEREFNLLKDKYNDAKIKMKY